MYDHAVYESKRTIPAVYSTCTLQLHAGITISGNIGDHLFWQFLRDQAVITYIPEISFGHCTARREYGK